MVGLTTYYNKKTFKNTSCYTKKEQSPGQFRRECMYNKYRQTY